jgi:dGTPase
LGEIWAFPLFSRDENIHAFVVAVLTKKIDPYYDCEIGRIKHIKKNFLNCAIYLQADDSRAKRLHDDESPRYSGPQYRGNYQRDRDRILYTASFRRLVGKTQIFNVGGDDNYRNRITHTLEVMQIATTITKALGLNSELTEAIALGHDIGHTPFGHAGERTLNYIMNNCDIIDKKIIIFAEDERGFKHNLQGLRILCDIEKQSRNYHGKNITINTLWGIANHTDAKWEECKFLNKEDWYCSLRKNDKKCHHDNTHKTIYQCVDFYDKYLDELSKHEAWTFEAYVIKYADEIAQRHHDIEDGIISSLFTAKDFIIKFEDCFKGTKCYNKDIEKIVENIKDEMNQHSNEINKYNNFILPRLRKFTIDFYVTNYILGVSTQLCRIINKYGIKNNSDFYNVKQRIFEENDIDGLMNFSQRFIEPDKKIKEALKDTVLYSQKAQLMDGKGMYIIRKLFDAYLNTPNQLPDHIIAKIFIEFGKLKVTDEITKYYIGELRNEMKSRPLKDRSFFVCLCRNICDYISSMTDRYALKQYENLYEPIILH